MNKYVNIGDPDDIVTIDDIVSRYADINDGDICGLGEYIDGDFANDFGFAEYEPLFGQEYKKERETVKIAFYITEYADGNLCIESDAIHRCGEYNLNPDDFPPADLMGHIRGITAVCKRNHIDALFIHNA